MSYQRYLLVRDYSHYQFLTSCFSTTGETYLLLPSQIIVLMSQPGVTLFPTPPPTLNNLDPQQRTRLLRCTRKLEALLGTTPYLFEQVDPVSPRTAKAQRREARIFETPSTPSNSSPSRSFSPLKTTPDSDGSFVLVTRTSSLENPLPPFKLTLDINVLAEKQKGGTSLKTSTPKKKDRSNRPIKSKSKSKTKTAPVASVKKGTVPTPLPQTLVLCLRSVPVLRVDAHPGHGHSNPSLSIFSPSNPNRTLPPNTNPTPSVSKTS